MGVLGYGGTVVFKLKRGLGTPVDADITDLYTPSHPQFLIAAPGKDDGRAALPGPLKSSESQKAARKKESIARAKQGKKDKKKSKSTETEEAGTANAGQSLKSENGDDVAEHSNDESEEIDLMYAPNRQAVFKQQKQRKGPQQGNKQKPRQHSTSGHKPELGANSKLSAEENLADMFAWRVEHEFCKPMKSHLWNLMDNFWKKVLQNQIDEHQLTDILPSSTVSDDERFEVKGKTLLRMYDPDIEKISFTPNPPQQPHGYTIDDKGEIISDESFSYADKRNKTPSTQTVDESKQEVIDNAVAAEDIRDAAEIANKAEAQKDDEDAAMATESKPMTGESKVKHARLFDRLVRVWRHCHYLYEITTHYQRKLLHLDDIDDRQDITKIQEIFGEEAVLKTGINPQDRRCFKFLSKQGSVAARCFVWCIHETLLQLTYRMRPPAPRDSRFWWAGMAGLFLTSYEAPSQFVFHKFGPLALLLRHDGIYCYENKTIDQETRKMSTRYLELNPADIKTMSDLMQKGLQLLDSQFASSAQLLACLSLHNLLSEKLLLENISPGLEKTLKSFQATIKQRYISPVRQTFGHQSSYRPPNKEQDPNRNWLFGSLQTPITNQGQAAAQTSLMAQTILTMLHNFRSLHRCPIRSRMLLGWSILDYEDDNSYRGAMRSKQTSKFLDKLDNFDFTREHHDYFTDNATADLQNYYMKQIEEKELNRRQFQSQRREKPEPVNTGSNKTSKKGGKSGLEESGVAVDFGQLAAQKTAEEGERMLTSAGMSLTYNNVEETMRELQYADIINRMNSHRMEEFADAETRMKQVVDILVGLWKLVKIKVQSGSYRDAAVNLFTLVSGEVQDEKREYDLLKKLYKQLKLTIDAEDSKAEMPSMVKLLFGPIEKDGIEYFLQANYTHVLIAFRILMSIQWNKIVPICLDRISRNKEIESAQYNVIQDTIDKAITRLNTEMSESSSAAQIAADLEQYSFLFLSNVEEHTTITTIPSTVVNKVLGQEFVTENFGKWLNEIKDNFGKTEKEVENDALLNAPPDVSMTTEEEGTGSNPILKQAVSLFLQKLQEHINSLLEDRTLTEQQREEIKTLTGDNKTKSLEEWQQQFIRDKLANFVDENEKVPEKESFYKKEEIEALGSIEAFLSARFVSTAKDDDEFNEKDRSTLITAKKHKFVTRLLQILALYGDVLSVDVGSVLMPDLKTFYESLVTPGSTSEEAWNSIKKEGIPSNKIFQAHLEFVINTVPVDSLYDKVKGTETSDLQKEEKETLLCGMLRAIVSCAYTLEQDKQGLQWKRDRKTQLQILRAQKHDLLMMTPYQTRREMTDEQLKNNSLLCSYEQGLRLFCDQNNFKKTENATKNDDEESKASKPSEDSKPMPSAGTSDRAAADVDLTARMTKIADIETQIVEMQRKINENSHLAIAKWIEDNMYQVQSIQDAMNSSPKRLQYRNKIRGLQLMQELYKDFKVYEGEAARATHHFNVMRVIGDERAKDEDAHLIVLLKRQLSSIVEEQSRESNRVLRLSLEFQISSLQDQMKLSADFQEELRMRVKSLQEDKRFKAGKTVVNSVFQHKDAMRKYLQGEGEGQNSIINKNLMAYDAVVALCNMQALESLIESINKQNILGKKKDLLLDLQKQGLMPHLRDKAIDTVFLTDPMIMTKSEVNWTEIQSTLNRIMQSDKKDEIKELQDVEKDLGIPIANLAYLASEDPTILKTAFARSPEAEPSELHKSFSEKYKELTDSYNAGIAHLQAMAKTCHEAYHAVKDLDIEMEDTHGWYVLYDLNPDWQVEGNTVSAKPAKDVNGSYNLVEFADSNGDSHQIQVRKVTLNGKSWKRPALLLPIARDATIIVKLASSELPFNVYDVHEKKARAKIQEYFRKALNITESIQNDIIKAAQNQDKQDARKKFEENMKTDPEFKAMIEARNKKQQDEKEGKGKKGKSIVYNVPLNLKNVKSKEANRDAKAENAQITKANAKKAAITIRKKIEEGWQTLNRIEYKDQIGVLQKYAEAELKRFEQDYTQNWLVWPTIKNFVTEYATKALQSEQFISEQYRRFQSKSGDYKMILTQLEESGETQFQSLLEDVGKARRKIDQIRDRIQEMYDAKFSEYTNGKNQYADDKMEFSYVNENITALRSETVPNLKEKQEKFKQELLKLEQKNDSEDEEKITNLGLALRDIENELENAESSEKNWKRHKSLLKEKIKKWEHSYSSYQTMKQASEEIIKSMISVEAAEAATEAATKAAKQQADAEEQDKVKAAKDIVFDDKVYNQGNMNNAQYATMFVRVDKEDRNKLFYDKVISWTASIKEQLEKLQKRIAISKISKRKISKEERGLVADIERALMILQNNNLMVEQTRNDRTKEVTDALNSKEAADAKKQASDDGDPEAEYDFL